MCKCRFVTKRYCAFKDNKYLCRVSKHKPKHFYRESNLGLSHKTEKTYKKYC